MNVRRISYKGPPLLLKNGLVETLYTATRRKVRPIPYLRERITTPDDDFLDLDWHRDSGNTSLAILVHGLEGDSQRHYIRSLGHNFIRSSCDILAWNARSCSGEMNRNFKMYSHADIDDLSYVVENIVLPLDYERIFLVGVSMGGNMVLKMAGSTLNAMPHSERFKTVAISTPLHLESSANALDKPSNWMIKRKFYKRLSKKIKLKAQSYPRKLDISLLKKVKKWRDFDEYFSAPLGGFHSAYEFYESGSGLNYLSTIRTPCLIINAANDPILEKPSYMIKDIHNPHIQYEISSRGGHVGFNIQGEIWNYFDKRCLEFCMDELDYIC